MCRNAYFGLIGSRQITSHFIKIKHSSKKKQGTFLKCPKCSIKTDIVCYIKSWYKYCYYPTLQNIDTLLNFLRGYNNFIHKPKFITI